MPHHVNMLDIFTSMLPLGVEVVDVKEQSEAYRIQLKQKDNVAVTYLRKCVTPGYERRHCTHALVNAMSSIAINKEQYTVARIWLDKLQEPRHGEFTVMKVDTITHRNEALYEWLDNFEDAYLLAQLAMTRKQDHEIIMICPGSNRSIDKRSSLYNKALELEKHVLRYMASSDFNEEEEVNAN